MTSKIKVDNISDQNDNNIINESGDVITVGAAGDTVAVAGNIVKSNAYQASDGGNIASQSGTTITLGASGDTVTLASGASQSGFGRSGTVDWETTPKTATFTAVSGEGYFCNTTGGAFTVNLPAGSAGAIVSLADYAATWQTNNLTVSPNGSEKIGGVNADVTLNTEGQSVTFVYVDSTQGWINTMDSTSNERGLVPFLVATGGTITTSGNCKIHTFTGPGTFTVTAASTTPSNNQVGYLVVAGGGNGAGGFREGRCGPVTPYTDSPLGTSGLTVTATAFPITVGGGGIASGGSAAKGSNSTFSTITSAGGGTSKGGCRPGGSGAGANNATQGSGNTPPVSPPQGNPGGPNVNGQSNSGGGGATEAGQPNNGPNNPGGRGGAGTTTSITGSSTAYAGGGGGSANAGLGFTAGAGSPCGTGGVGTGSGTTSVAGTANTGGGGGTGSPEKSGGSGIVVIRYKFQ